MPKQKRVFEGNLLRYELIIGVPNVVLKGKDDNGKKVSGRIQDWFLHFCAEKEGRPGKRVRITVEVLEESTTQEKDAELSEEGKRLLKYLAQYDFCLAYRNCWKAIPSPQYKDDGRMDWKIKHPECVQELIDLFLVVECGDDPDVYKLSERGRRIAQATN